IRDEVVDGVRSRRYWETPSFLTDVSWAKSQPVPWTAADRLDPRRPEYNVPPQLYNLDAVAYESLLVGLFTIWRGERDVREKPNALVLGYSRDGFHWDRPDRRAFIGVSERVGDWNWANVQSAGGVCLIVGDRLYFYVSGRRGVPGTNDPGVCSTGLMTLRRDGFASMDAPAPDARRIQRLDLGSGPGMLVTRPLRFSGRRLFLNLDAPEGELRADVLRPDGSAIAGFRAADCIPARGNATRLPLDWRDANLAALAGQPVRVRFHLTRGSLYAFWVSGSARGASGGYV